MLLKCFCKGDIGEYLESLKIFKTKTNLNFLAVFCQYIKTNLDTVEAPFVWVQ